MNVSNDILLDVMIEAAHRFSLEMRQEYKAGKLELYLEKHGMEDLIPKKIDTYKYDTFPNGKIFIFGDSAIKPQVIFGILKELGINKDRIELHLDYNELKNFDFKTLQYNPIYRLILVGPVPHSMVGKEDASSVITNLENKDGYPKIIRLMDSNGLKITKTSLKNALEKEIEARYLEI